MVFGVKWEAWEVDVLVKNRFSRMTAYEVLSHRTKTAIDTKFQKTKIAGIKRMTYRRWSIADLRFALQKRSDGMSWEDIGDLFGVDGVNIQNVVRYHKMKGHLE